jgi:hypothetical protein
MSRSTAGPRGCALAAALAVAAGCGSSDEPPTIVDHPEGATVDEGGEAWFYVSTPDPGVVTYRWQRSDDSGSTWTDVPGATEAEYVLAGVTFGADDGAAFRCVVTGGNGSTISEGAFLTVIAVIDFEPAPLPSGSMSIASYEEDCALLTPASSGTFGHSASGRDNWPDNGTAYLSMSSGSAPADIEPTVPGLFTLHSVDLAEYSGVFAEPRDVTFECHGPEGDPFAVTFSLDGVFDGTGPGDDFETFVFPPEAAGLTRVVVTTTIFSMDNLRMSIDR